jgi:hypothetical protein
LPPVHIDFNGRFRRFSRVRVFAGEGLLAEPIAGPQLQWRELVFMPQSRQRQKLRRVLHSTNRTAALAHSSGMSRRTPFPDLRPGVLAYSGDHSDRRGGADGRLRSAYSRGKNRGAASHFGLGGLISPCWSRSPLSRSVGRRYHCPVRGRSPAGRRHPRPAAAGVARNAPAIAKVTTATERCTKPLEQNEAARQNRRGRAARRAQSPEFSQHREKNGSGIGQRPAPAARARRSLIPKIEASQ